MGWFSATMGNEPSSSSLNKTEDLQQRHSNNSTPAAVVQGYPSAPPPYSDDLDSKAELPPLPRKDIPKNAVPVPFEHPTGGSHPKGVLYLLGTDGGKSNYLNPLARGKCEVFSSSVEVGILATLVENAVGYFSTNDEACPWFQVSLGVNHQVYPEHYVLGGCETGHRDDMMRSWKLEASLDGENWDLLTQHASEEYFTDSGRYCGPKGWHCFRVPPSGPYRHFRLSHTGTTISGSRSLLASGFEVFGHLATEELA